MKKYFNKKNLPEIVISILFFGFLTVMAVVTVIRPKEKFSDMENKTLQSFPKFSTKALFDGTYLDKVETYVSDHFAGRVSWIELKADTEHLIGKNEQKGIYVLNDRLIEKIEEVDYTEIDKSIAAINNFADDNALPVYMMLVPTSAEFYKHQMPDYMPNLDQKKFIDYIHSNLNDNVNFIDVYNTMAQNANEYIFYRTDHHWTTHGAYLAYNAAGEAMGYTPAAKDNFSIEQVSDSFKGTFYSKALYDGIEDDKIDYYISDTPVTVEVTSEFGKEPVIYDSMYFRDYLDVKDKYSSFLGTNQPIVTIKTGNEGKKILLIKDSYAHCYAPFLAENYSEITLLDMRYIQISYKSIIDVSEYDQVLFLYNASSFATDRNVKKLSYGG